jgi:hypothetical protein
MLEDLGLPAVVVGFILTWDDIINRFLQPWAVARSDQARTRFGWRKPRIMLGAFLAGLFFILVPFAREHFALFALAILGTFWALVNINSLHGLRSGDERTDRILYRSLPFFILSCGNYGPNFVREVDGSNELLDDMGFIAAFILLAGLLLFQVRLKDK